MDGLMLVAELIMVELALAGLAVLFQVWSFSVKTLGVL